MQKTKLKRKALAQRLFACTAIFNCALLFFIWPAESQETPPPVALEQHVEIKIKGQLHMQFEQNKKILLTHPELKTTLVAILNRQDEEGISIWIPEETYHLHHRPLIQFEWALIPYIPGMTAKKTQGKFYEIAY